MSWAGSEAITVLIFLLPGFVASAVFYSLTPHLRPTGVERIIQALMFTTVIQGIYKGFLLVEELLSTGASRLEEWETLVVLPLAVVVALFGAYFANHDTTSSPLEDNGVDEGDFLPIGVVFDVRPKAPLNTSFCT